MRKNKVIPFLSPLSAALFLLLALCLTSSCKVDVQEEYSPETEMQDLAEYIRIHNITATPTASGLYYISLREGTGAQVQKGETVTVRYTGRLLNGMVFDSGSYSFVLGSGRVIRGWDEGIGYMRHGGMAQLIIPSSLAYGAGGAGSIPPYNSLVFDVELL